MTQEQAEALALLALSHIVGDLSLREKFMNLTGLQPDDFQERMNDPEFLGALLDFLLAHEPDLMEFCTAGQIDPQRVVAASAQLSGPAAQHWS